MKKVLLSIIGGLVLLAGMALVCYPFISNYLMDQNQSSQITSQQTAIKNTSESEIDKAFRDARKYNKSLLGNIVLTDPFDPGFQDEKNPEYYNLLNLNHDSIMANIEIPKIRVNLPIFHGTSSEVLEKGAGHLQKTSLPVGGKNTHCVITGHTGLSTARLFTDISQLEKGDIFYINVLNKKLAYKVDKIQVVLPENTDPLRIVPNKDYVTLVTCTPYGVNSHRLLVRGERTSLKEAEKVEEKTPQIETLWMKKYKQGLIIGAISLAVILIIFFTIRAIRRKKKKNKITNEA